MTFEEKREEYYNLLRNNLELLYKIIEDNKNKEKSLEILLTPKNDRELEIAKCIFSYFNSFLNFVNNINDDKIKNIDIENNKSLDLLIEVINTLKEENKEKINELEKYLSKTIDPLFMAKLMYDSTISFSINAEEVQGYIMYKTGFDPSDELDNIRFQIYINRANKMIYKNKIDFKLDESNIDSNEVTSTLIMINEFNRLCEDGLKDEYKRKLTDE